MKKKNIEQTFPDIIADVRYHSAKLWDRIDQSAGPTACWTWHGPKHTQGYGMVGGVRIATQKKIMQTVHRLLLKIKLNKDIGSNDAVHTCGTMTCVNPAHLFEGTAKEILQIRKANGRDSLGKRKGTVARGPRVNWTYKYPVEVILAVKRREINPKQFAARFNIPIEQAQKAVYGMRDKNSFKWVKFINQGENL